MECPEKLEEMEGRTDKRREMKREMGFARRGAGPGPGFAAVGANKCSKNRFQL